MSRNDRHEEEQSREARRELAHAREAESVWTEARAKVRDAATLRLFTLETELRPYVAAMPEAKGLIDLALVPGYPPRLWIDLSAYVLVADDGRTMQLVQETLDERRVLFSSRSVEDTTAFLKRFIAHRVARRHRMLAAEMTPAELLGETPPAAPAAAPSAAPAVIAEPPAEKAPEQAETPALSLWLVWLAGIVTGILLLATYLVLSGDAARPF